MKEDFLQSLLKQSWVREEYYLSDVTGKTLNGCGQLLLSKYPFQGFIYTFSPKKNVIFGRLFFNDRDLVIPVVHLTSSHEKYGPHNATMKRDEQMDLLKELFTLNSLSADYPTFKKGDGLVMGDFNIGDEEEENKNLVMTGFLDLWKELHPDQPGYTFDTENNPLAGLASKKGPRRIDRVLLRSEHWSCSKMMMFGNQPKAVNISDKEVQLYPSDHYGLFFILDKK